MTARAAQPTPMTARVAQPTPITARAALAGVGIGVLLAIACGGRRGEVAPPAPAAPLPPAHAAAAPSNGSPFAPAFTRVDERLGKIDVAMLGDPVQCAGCHADVVAQWDPSAHHASSFTNRFYAAAVALTRADRGNKASRWCAGCHDPTLLLGLAIDRDDVATHPRAGDGVGCLVCHSMAEGSRTGGGGYLLGWKPFVEPDTRSAVSVAKHRADMHPAALGKAEQCASCHKVSIHEDVNGKRWYRGQNDFDAWEQGPFALGGEKTAGAIYAPDVAPQTCIDCHMKRESATRGDLAAKAHVPGGDKTVRSHRFLAANTAVAAFAYDHDTVERQRASLANAVRVEVAAVRHLRAPSPGRAEKPEAPVAAGEDLAIDVVVENTRVGHRFPAGTADSNEAWLAIEVRDARGELVAESGALDAKGVLAADAHRFGVLQLDTAGRPAMLRDAHRFAAVGWDNTIPPRDARVVRFGLSVPSGVALPLSVKTQVLYRKFSVPYAAFACATKAASGPAPATCPPLPVVTVAHDEVRLGAPTVTARGSDTWPPEWKRLDAYARGLLNATQEDVGDAAPIVAEVIRLAPDAAHGYIDRARMLIREGRTADALAELDLAATRDPTTPVIPFLRGIAHYEVYRLGDAVEALQLASARAPKNLHALELLAEALQLRGNDRSTLRASIDVSQLGLTLDPESAQLRHLEALAFDALGQPGDADLARAEYLAYRRDDDTPRLRSLCKKEVPGCALESNPLHVHALDTRSHVGGLHQ